MTVQKVTVMADGEKAKVHPDNLPMMRDDELEFVPGSGAAVHCTIHFLGVEPFPSGPRKFEGKKLPLGRPKPKQQLPQGDYKYELRNVKIITPGGGKAAAAVDPTIKIKDPPPTGP